MNRPRLQFFSSQASSQYYRNFRGRIEKRLLRRFSCLTLFDALVVLRPLSAKFVSSKLERNLMAGALRLVRELVVVDCLTSVQQVENDIDFESNPSRGQEAHRRPILRLSFEMHHC